MSDMTFDEVLELAQRLPFADKGRLARAMIAEMEQEGTRPEVTPDEQIVREIRSKLYAKARRYWESVGDQERLALTDNQLDEQFWLFDSDGIPRLKSEEGTIEIPANSLYRLGEAAEKYGSAFGPGDVSERSREILNTEFAEYLLKRMSDESE